MQNKVDGVEILETKLEKKITAHHTDPEQKQLHVYDKTRSKIMISFQSLILSSSSTNYD